MDLHWTHEDQVRILERYWAAGVVRCPIDGAVLKAIKSQTIGPPPPQIFFLCPQCGRSFRSSQVEKYRDPNSFEGKYEVVGELAKGGMGTVVQARRRADLVVVAAKKILPQYTRDVDAVKRFDRERRILTAVEHPNVVRVLDTYLDDQGGVIVMEYIRGGTLKSAINDPGVPAKTLLLYFAGIVDGLRFLHEHGIVHRDLKPENVLIDGSTARISDFGLARLLDRDTTTLTMRGSFLGTRAYAAPEQELDSAGVTPACDVYALGLIAFEIATRCSPYRMPINSMGLACELHEALAKALSPDPGQRPTDGAILLEALQAQLLP